MTLVTFQQVREYRSHHPGGGLDAPAQLPELVEGGVDEALAAANQAVKYAADNQDSHYTLGLILQKKQQYKEAEQAMLRALALNPANADVHLSLGDLYAEDLKDQKKAAASYKKYLEAGGMEGRAKDYVEKAGTAKQ